MGDAAFNVDELEAQARAGAYMRSHGIRDFMLEQHRDFFASLGYVFASIVGADGWPLAGLLEGRPGFIESPDATTLRVRALPQAGDPAAGTMRVGGHAALIGIDFATRRRNRANGVVSALDQTSFTLAVRQSFGNCPQYIQRRVLDRSAAEGTDVRGHQSVQTLDRLDDRARALIGRADTFLVASRSRSGLSSAGGADISHRGGRPGFVRVENDTLSIPDFRGNGYFNTFGNLLGEPRCSLLFTDFESGDVLTLQGRARIDWAAGGLFPGAERTWSVEITRAWYRAQASAVRGAFLDYSPVTLRTGSWV